MVSFLRRGILNPQLQVLLLISIHWPLSNIKKSVIIGFVYRIYRSCSSWSLIHQGLEKAKDILVKNQYPMKLIDSVFHETLEKIITQTENQNVDDKNVIHLDKNACLLNVQDKDKFNFFFSTIEAR